MLTGARGMTIKDDGAICGFCGAHIVGPAFARDGQEYCCEGCFLKEKEFSAV